MNILFVTSHEPSLINGGVEHVTIQVAQCLAQNYGHHCFSLYNHCVDTITNDIFEAFQLLPTNNQQHFFEKYLEQHAIECGKTCQIDLCTSFRPILQHQDF